MSRREMRIVLDQELGRIWWRGPGTWVILGIAVAMSVVAVGLSYTSQINLLDAREGLAVLVRLSVGIGLVLAGFAAADSISGERDRSTLESLLLTPVDHRQVLLAKLAASASWWAAALLVSAPYLIVMGIGHGGIAALGVSASVGAALMVLIVGAGGLLSARFSSTVQSAGAMLLGLAVLAVPGILPGALMRGTVGTFVLRADPLTAAQQFLNLVVIDQRPAADEWPWLLSPVIAAVGAVVLVWRVGDRIELEPGA